jgi:hypothetical protein
VVSVREEDSSLRTGFSGDMTVPRSFSPVGEDAHREQAGRLLYAGIIRNRR